MLWDTKIFKSRNLSYNILGIWSEVPSEYLREIKLILSIGCVFLFHECCWYAVLLGYLMFLHILQTELTSFLQDYLSKDICTENSLRNLCVSLWSKGQAYLLPIIKTLGFLSSGFPPVRQPLGIHWHTFVLPLWDLR